MILEVREPRVDNEETPADTAQPPQDWASATVDDELITSFSVKEVNHHTAPFPTYKLCIHITAVQSGT